MVLGTGCEDLGLGVCNLHGFKFSVNGVEDRGQGNVILGQRQLKLRYLKAKQRSVGCAARKLPERASARNIKRWIHV